MTLTVGELRAFLENCADDDVVVVSGSLGDGSVVRVEDLNVGTDQGGPDGRGIEVVLDWEPGSESLTR